MQIRLATADDVPALAELYDTVVKAAGPAYYSPTQVRSWAAFSEDRTAFRRFILRPQTFVAVDEAGVLGFCGLDKDGHIASLYVSANRLRQGIGAKLLRHALSKADESGLSRLYAETGPFSFPLFQQFGFRLTEIETVERGDAVFERYLVERILNHPESSAQKVVAAHYDKPSLYENIIAAIAADRNGNIVDGDPAIHIDDLVPVDAFHVGGRAATKELVAQVELGPDDVVLDVGSGIGGTSRYLASTAGCRVIGVDLSETYCRTARKLSEAAGLSSRIEFFVADALSLPLPDRHFDVVWTEHAQMNIADKRRFYTELARVLRPGGALVFHDIFAASNATPIFPVPWASGPTLNHLIRASELRRLLLGMGFRIDNWVDWTSNASSALRRSIPQFEDERDTALGMHLLMGPDTSLKVRNLLHNFETDSLAAVQAVLTLEA